LQNFFFLPASCNCRKTSGLLNKSSFYLFIFGGELLHPCNNNKKSKMEIFSHKFPDLLRNNSLLLHGKKKKRFFREYFTTFSRMVSNDGTSENSPEKKHKKH